MSVERFRSVEETNAAPIRSDAGNALERFIRHGVRHRKIARHRYPAGVFKFRLLEEAHSARADVTDTAGDAGAHRRRR